MIVNSVLEVSGPLIVRGDDAFNTLIKFKMTSYTPGRPEVRYLRNGDPGWPAEPMEFEYRFLEACIDASKEGVKPSDLTAFEVEAIRTWCRSGEGCGTITDAVTVEVLSEMIDRQVDQDKEPQ